MIPPTYLVITLDVEEEGLFSGRYARSGSGVANVAALQRLEFVARDFGFPLTLLVTYPVVQDAAAREVLAAWQQEQGAEIGVHLHPWNTPPFTDLPNPEPIPSRKLPPALLEAKIRTLVECLTDHFGGAPRAFRMGRFDLIPQVLELLPTFGLRVDSSMVPLTFKGMGSENFLAPADPFWLEFPGLAGARVLEAPVTMVPVWKASVGAVHWLAGLLPDKLGAALLSRYRFVGAAGVHPAWFPLFSMRLAAWLHRRRGGRILTVFLHSSELFPGGNPQFATAAAVDRLVARFRSFLTWLVKQGPVQGLTLSGLYDLAITGFFEDKG